MAHPGPNSEEAASLAARLVGSRVRDRLARDVEQGGAISFPAVMSGAVLDRGRHQGRRLIRSAFRSA